MSWIYFSGVSWGPAEVGGVFFVLYFSCVDVGAIEECDYG